MIYIVTSYQYNRRGMLCKIGHTGQGVGARVRQLETGHGAHLFVLMAFDGDKSLESLLHTLCAPLHVFKEWYAFPPGHIMAIARQVGACDQVDRALELITSIRQSQDTIEQLSEGRSW